MKEKHNLKGSILFKNKSNHNNKKENQNLNITSISTKLSFSKRSSSQHLPFK